MVINKEKMFEKALLLVTAMSLSSVNVLASSVGGTLDLGTLFVEQVFGSVFLAIVGCGVMMYLIGWYTRMSPLMINYIVLLYVCGALATVAGYQLILFVLFMSVLVFLYNKYWRHMEGV